MSNINQIKTCVTDEKHPVFVVGNNVKLDDKSYGLLNESNEELFIKSDGSKKKTGSVGSGSLIMTKKAIVNGWYSLNNQTIHSTDYVDKNGTINHVHSTQVIESITNEIPLIFDDIFIGFSSKKVLTL